MAKAKKQEPVLGTVPEYSVSYSREEKLWGVHINGTSTYILKRPVGKKNMYYVGTRYCKTLRDAIFSVVLGTLMPFQEGSMNHELIIILMHLKSRTFHNVQLCNEIYRWDTCKGIGCSYCVLNTSSPTSDRYASRLLFRIPI